MKSIVAFLTTPAARVIEMKFEMLASDKARWKKRGKYCLVRCFGLSSLSVGLILSAVATAAGNQPSAGTTTQKSGQPPGLCYAFLRHSSLWTACEGKRERVELGDRVDDFAVSVDGLNLVFQKFQKGSTGRSVASRLTMVSLGNKTGAKAINVEGEGRLYATCGTVVHFGFWSWHALDVLTTTPLHFSPYQYFKCSSDRRSIVGWTEQDDAERRKRAESDMAAIGSITLRTGQSGGSTLASIDDPPTFDISPNGEFVSYFTWLADKHYALCVTARSSGSQRCVSDGGHQVSVANNGDVVFWSPNEDSSDVRYWHLGSPDTVLLEKGASNPQWITPRTAASLHEWNQRAQHP